MERPLKAIALRKRVARVVMLAPLGSIRWMVARVGSVSTQALQDDPTPA
jgi:hypothetical protein